jgi:hypothetical protein
MDLSTIMSFSPFLLTILYVWSLTWKGFALWKSSKKTEIVWFIFILILSTVGLFEIGYIYLFSKIKDAKQFKKIHDILLIIAAISIPLSLLNPYVIIILTGSMAFFGISVLQKIADGKNRNWLILGIIFNPIVTIVYYFKKLRNPTKQ